MLLCETNYILWICNWGVWSTLKGFIVGWKFCWNLGGIDGFMQIRRTSTAVFLFCFFFVFCFLFLFFVFFYISINILASLPQSFFGAYTAIDQVVVRPLTNCWLAQILKCPLAWLVSIGRNVMGEMSPPPFFFLSFLFFSFLFFFFFFFFFFDIT